MVVRPRETMTGDPGVVAVDFRVRYAETDQMGVVYHANYLVWCEVARTELIRRRFLPYAEIEKRGIMLAVSDAAIRYHAPARYDDLVRVEAWISLMRSRTVTFEYRIMRVADGRPPDRLATVTTTLVGLDRESRPTKLPPDLVAALRPGRVTISDTV
jgi:acyl-CoA thioester hydrolase